MSYSSMNTITTVAKREMRVALRNKGIMVSVVLTLVLTLAGIGALTLLSEREGGQPSIAVVGMNAPTPEESEVIFVNVADREDAMTSLEMGDDDAALVPTEQGWELLAEGDPSPTVLGAATQLVNSQATEEALAGFGLTPEEFATALPPTTVIPVDLGADATTEINYPAVLTVLAGVVVLMFTVMLFAGNIGGRVTAEKSSRVVEIILASVRPMDFLAGKILGNVIFGFLATTVMVIIAGAALAFSGLLEGLEFDWGILAVLLVGFLLGMIFFGSLYAAAGAMVQRTEDLQSTQMPILLLLIATIYSATFGFNALDSTWMEVLAWVPPMSVAVAPLQYAAGNFGLGQLALSYGILALTNLLAIWLVARIYRAAILNNGRRMTWRQALTAR
ncbi:ABC transporter permease [Corynebacterium sp. YIM 101645]|uniref:ABC transporter permease n=2 Tax=Corynebacterium lemuris TaxID=1859292 RepID=A0ABT2G0H1_9CORY|nr:ABC transporter permease [Corynebacterium lemuris]MCS5480485.1 ABC transporter permease [Corynebacterium lemuris]